MSGLFTGFSAGPGPSSSEPFKHLSPAKALHPPRPWQPAGPPPASPGIAVPVSTDALPAHSPAHAEVSWPHGCALSRAVRAQHLIILMTGNEL